MKLVLLLSVSISFYLYFVSAKSITAGHVHFIPFQHHPAIRVAIINAVAYHGEVWYSYMYAAAVRCKWRVSLFTTFLPSDFRKENGLSFITRSWSRPLLSTSEQHVSELVKLNSTICLHQIIIICTIQDSPLVDILRMLMDQCDKDTPYLVILQLHQAHNDISMVENIFKEVPYLQLQKHIELRYTVLAEHVKDYTEHHMETSIGVDIWRLVFPLDFPPHLEEDHYDSYFDFVIQGTFDSKRRNYFDLAVDIKRHLPLLYRHKIAFTFAGRASASKTHHYLKLANVRLFLPPHYMPANAFFGFIYQAVGMITIFAADEYYIDVQSTTISSSILTQTPLVASQRLLDSHKYIPKEAVWLKYDNETDVACILRIIKSFPSTVAFRKALFARRQRLKILLEDLYMNNERKLNDYANSIRLRQRSP